ncbi:MAG: Sulfate transport system permease protein CysW [Planctomycetota bacterium]|jgi:sulfate transport system permease protein
MSQTNNIGQASRDPKWVQWILIALTVGFISLLLILPLGVIFWEAFRKGIKTYTLALTDRNARSAIALTVLATAISVPVNMLFGLAAAWMTTKYSFWGKSLLISIIDLPFAISPVIAGLMLILLYGINGWFGATLQSMGMQVIFAVPGVILATMFVTVPFVARELIPVMQEQGSEQEWAAISLGASAWQTFLKVTLPNIRWALLYGVLLCSARAMGEFGAVSVVSSNIRGLTNTLPLQIDALYNDYNAPAAFALASILAALSILTLIAKSWLEMRIEHRSKDLEEVS